MKKWRGLQRAFAIALAVACILTSSGFTVLAAEVSSNTVSSNSISSNTVGTDSKTDEQESPEAGNTGMGDTDTESSEPATPSEEESSEEESSEEESSEEESSEEESSEEESSEEDLEKTKSVSVKVYFVDEDGSVVGQVTLEAETDEDGNYYVSSEAIEAAMGETLEEYTLVDELTEKVTIGSELTVDINVKNVNASSNTTANRRSWATWAVARTATRAVDGADRYAAAKLSDDNFAERPSNAEIFFASADEAYSFNTATYWDIYQSELGVPKNSHSVSSSSFNYGLTLASSTDGYLVNSNAGSDTGASYGAVSGLVAAENSWGNFGNGYKLTFNNVVLKDGDNDINIEVKPGADIRTLAITDGNGNIIKSLTPGGQNTNVQSSTTNDDGAVGTSSANNKSDGWIEVNGRAAYKCLNGNNCFGYLDNGSVTYHFTNVTAGTYNLTLEYTGTNSGDNGIKATVNGSSSGSDAMRIDYETAVTYKYKQYTESDESYTIFNYSDGTSTVVGWGGDFNYDNIQTDRLLISLKQVAGPDISTVLEHLTIKLVNKSGGVVQSISGYDLENSDFTADANYDAFQTGFLEGYTTYVSDSFDPTVDIQGIKLIFESDEGSDMVDISGTIDVGFVGLLKGDKWQNTSASGSYSQDYMCFSNKDNWNTFSTFNYANATKMPYEELNKALNENVKPYLRKSGTINDNKTESGHNRQADSWHMWTMSTSDANIVSNESATRNGTGTYNALEIKYRNDGTHQTTASLTLDQSKRTAPSGEWLVINLKGEDTDLGGTQNEEILKMNLILNGTDTISLSNFRVEPDDAADYIAADKVAEGYHTIYYHVGTSANKYSLNKVEFDFSAVTNAEASDADTHRVYVKDIYLINPTLTIVKSGATQAALGEEFTYTLTVKNPSDQAVTNYTVSDTLPSGLTYVAGKATVDGTAKEPSVSGQALSWTIGSIAAGGTAEISFTVEVTDLPSSGNTYYNYATVTVGGVSQNSKTIKTVVVEQAAEDMVYYAEVGQKTTLDVDAEGTSVVPIDQKATAVAMTASGGWGSDKLSTTIVTSDDENAEFTFVKGWNKIIIDLTDKSGDYDANMSKVRLLTADGSNTEIASAVPNSSNCIVNSSWSAYVDPESYIEQVWKQNASVIFLPVGKAPGCTFDTGANQIIGNVNQGKVIYMVYVPESAFTGKTIDGYIEFSYAMASPNQVDSADVTCQSAYSTTGELTLKQWGTDDAPAPSKGTVEYVDGNTLYYTPDADAAEGDGKDVFTVPTEEGMDIEITVYNYQVKDHIYVLDYGLKVSLTDETYGNGMLEDAILSHANSDEASGWAFSGLRETKRNTNSVADMADPNDYDAAGYGSTSLDLAQGKAAYVSNTSTNKLDVTYTPNKFMSSVDTFYYGVQVSKNGATDLSSSKTATPVMEGEIKVMPANVVYYEDNFVDITYTENNNDTGSDAAKGGSHSATQNNANDRLHGNDGAYSEDAGSSGQYPNESNGGVVVLNTSAGYVKNDDGTVTFVSGQSDTAQFNFTGTGFEIVGRTSKATGVLVVAYKSATDASSSWKVVVVDTFYANGDLYQIPVVRVADLARDEYTVKISVAASAQNASDSAGNINKTVFYLDGIRVYNSGNDEVVSNYEKTEQNVTFYNVNDILTGTGDVTNSMVNIDGSEYTVDINATGRQAVLVQAYADAENNEKIDGIPVLHGYSATEQLDGGTGNYTNSLVDYLGMGPNNEVYLGNEDAIAFYATPDTDINENERTLQVEAKKLNSAATEGDASELAVYTIAKDADGSFKKVKVDNATINTSTAMYYNITVDEEHCIKIGDKYLVMILGAANSTECISISNIKVKGYDLSVPEVDNANITLHGDLEELPSGIKTEILSVSNAKVKKDAVIRVKLSDIDSLDTSKISFKAYMQSAAATEPYNENDEQDVTFEAITSKAGEYDLYIHMPAKAQSVKLTVVAVYDGEDSPYSSVTTIKVKR